MNTNLETLQMLASDSSKLDLLKILQKKSGDETETPDTQAFSQQVGIPSGVCLLWANFVFVVYPNACIIYPQRSKFGKLPILIEFLQFPSDANVIMAQLLDS